MNPERISAYATDADFSAAINEAVKDLGITPLDKDLPGERPISELRRKREAMARDTVGLLSLVNEDGLLHWEDSPGILPHTLKGRRGLWGRKQKVVKQLKYQKLGFSEVAGYLEEFDQTLTPYWGLRRWDGGKLRACNSPSVDRPILLFIHGTFSRNEAIFDQLNHTEHGKNFLVKMQHYYEILSFDHPTLSVSPMINALDLARLLRNHPQAIDVICHSRGGLVTRWWLETFDSGSHGRRRAVLVGAPLEGTSLLAPDKLRHGIDLLTNVGHFLGEGLSLIPYLTVAAGLLRVVSSLGSMIASTPVIDAAVAAVPGLAGMSGVGNNFELKRLNTAGSGGIAPEYFTVASNFEPVGAGWRFWHHFTELKNRVAHLAADRLIFKAENDLVVDTASMFKLADGRIPDNDPGRVCRFHNSPTVHHTNYFLQTETLNFIEKTFLPPAS